jgi:tetratricopeptide (TPR) repeat protein
MGKRLLFVIVLVVGIGSGCGGGGGDGGGPEPDVTPPIITGGPNTSGIDHQGATVTWSTDENATSIVKYGKTTSYSDSVVSTAFVKSHSAKLTGLDALTLYHFKVFSADEAGNRVDSSDRTFTTGSPVSKFVNEGWDFFESGEFDSSLARFNAAKAIEPDNVEAHEGLAWAHLYRYDFAGCEAALEDAFAIDPDREDCLVAATFLYQATEAFEEAIEAGRDALDAIGSNYVFGHDSEVTDEDVRYSLILALAGAGDFTGALEEARVLDPSVSIDPEDPGTWGDHSTFEEAMIALIEDLRDGI